MATTLVDIKEANSTARRVGYEINLANMTRASYVGSWLRQIMRLEAEVRRYAKEHGVEVAA